MFCANLGAVLSIGGGTAWQTVVFSTVANKSLGGGGLRVDSSGSIITVGVDNNGSNVSTGAFITKLSSTGDKIWQRKVASTAFGNPVATAETFIAIDSADNVIATVYDVVNTLLYIFKYDSAGTLVWQRRVSPSNVTTGYLNHGITVDSADNIGLVYAPVSGTTVLTVSSAGAITQQKGYASLFITRSLSYTAANSRLVAGSVTEVGFPALLNIDSAGSIIWGRTFSVGRAGIINATTTDSVGNVYAVGSVNSVSGGLQQPIVLKYSSAGVLLWQKTFVSADTFKFKDCAVDVADLLYVVGFNEAAMGYGAAMCISGDGTVVWQTKIRSLVSPFSRVLSTGISARTPNTLVINSGVSVSGSSYEAQAIVCSFSSSTPPVGTWGWLTYEPLGLTISDLGFTGTTLTATVTTPANTIATPTLVNSVSAATVSKYPISSYLFWESQTLNLSADLDIANRDIAVANDGSLYLMSTHPSLVNAYITKLNALGQVVWQRRHTVASSTNNAARIALNAAQDTVYICLPRAGIDSVEVITYSTLGVLGLRKVIPTMGITLNNASNTTFDLGVDGGVYFCSQQNTTNANSLITKLDSSLALVYSKRLPVSGFFPLYNCLSVGSDGVYVATTEQSPSTGNGVLFKMSTDGTTVLWQRYIGPSATQLYPCAVKATAGGFVYVTFQYPSGTEIGLIKCNASNGTAVWQRRVFGLATVAFGTGPTIAVDSDDNSYVLIQVNNATPQDVAVLCKFDSAGNQVWQRKFTQAATYFLRLVSIKMAGADSIAITGVISSGWRTNGAVTYLLKTDGSGVNTTLGAMYYGAATIPAVPYAVSTYAVSNTTANNTTITTVTTSTYAMTITNGVGVSSVQTGAVSALFEIV